MFGSVKPFEVITSLGPLWNFAPGHQDAHELFHVFISALQAELQTSCKVSLIVYLLNNYIIFSTDLLNFIKIVEILF